MAPSNTMTPEELQSMLQRVEQHAVNSLHGVNTYATSDGFTYTTNSQLSAATTSYSARVQSLHFSNKSRTKETHVGKLRQYQEIVNRTLQESDYFETFNPGHKESVSLAHRSLAQRLLRTQIDTPLHLGSIRNAGDVKRRDRRNAIDAPAPWLQFIETFDHGAQRVSMESLWIDLIQRDAMGDMIDYLCDMVIEAGSTFEITMLTHTTPYIAQYLVSVAQEVAEDFHYGEDMPLEWLQPIFVSNFMGTLQTRDEHLQWIIYTAMHAHSEHQSWFRHAVRKMLTAGRTPDPLRHIKEQQRREQQKELLTR